MQDRILYEDNHLIIINKLPSEIVQGDKTGDTPLSEIVKHYLKEKYNKPGEVFLGVIHRLDRPVSGAVIFAKTSKALSRMNEEIREQQFKKNYWAIVAQQPPKEEDLLVDFLQRNEKLNKSFIVKNPSKTTKEAKLKYQFLGESERYFLLEIQLLTGRHHQIRAQLANIGCPIKGDLKYGFSTSNPDGSISLHARSIEFLHPVKQELIKVIAPIPDEKLWKFFENQQNKSNY